MAKAAADNTFTSSEKAELGLPEVVADASCAGSDTGGIELKTKAGSPCESSVEDSQRGPSVDGPRARASDHDTPSGEVAAHERLLLSSGEAGPAVTEEEVGDDDSQSELKGNARREVETTGSAAETAASAGSSDRSVDENARSGRAAKGDAHEGSATGKDIVDHIEHGGSIPVHRRDDTEDQTLDSGRERNAG